ncbi:MAG: bifunctional 5,10-methylenetetrahydrofolate dehydrogenase/5,10-methenyltetrahydrofolate cyclohydrolase [Bifidobacteriaceae bacterium]|jgi:methylenetetrahydrofolate dehydrogenase (NADP+)/methenyltetrahydrofolate cyclohydrolase|nr:bifunctional 5,10-methylenetetrahydrofolate dehydrogenase/5,10-methenyltetrahydrofolate cyclohydrolase [Bifidobacteriaceae bacterium]
MRILNGTKLAEQTKSELKAIIKKESEILDKTVLAIIIIGNDPASKKYVELKLSDCKEVGIKTRVLSLPENISTQTLIQNIKNLNDDQNITALIVQFPLPKHIFIFDILEFINPLKDADGLSLQNLGANLANINGEPLSILPCTPQAILDIAEKYKISFSEKQTLIIGRGLTVGRHLGPILSNKKYNSTCIMAHSKTKNLNTLIKSSDIVISAAGSAGIVNKDNIKKDSILFDVGISYKNGKLFGDINPNVKEKASALCPNPGGTGPMTRANLLKNVVNLAILKSHFFQKMT